MFAMNLKNKKSGVYCLTNLVNGKRYVGSSLDVTGRVRYSHLYQLRKETHSNKHLQASWNKYSEKNFTSEILETVKDTNQLISREQFYIDLYKTADPCFGYNNSPAAGSNSGYKWLEQSRQLKRKTVLQYDLKGNLIQRWENRGEAEKTLNLKPRSITKVLNSVRFGEFIWISESKKNTGIIERIVAKLENKLVKVSQYDLQGSFIRNWNSIREASEELGIERSGISACITKTYKSTGDFMWTRLGEKVPEIYKKETNLGFKWSEESRAKMRRPKSEETRKKLSLARRDRTYEDIYGDRAQEMRQKISLAGERRQARKVLQLESKTHEVINEFSSVKQALQYLGFTENRGEIANAAKSGRMFMHSRWKYKTELQNNI